MKIHWKKTPWTDTEVDALYASNAAFRRECELTAKAWASGKPTKDELKQVARTAAKISRELSPSIRKDEHIHPTHILQWVRGMAIADAGANLGGMTGQEYRVAYIAHFIKHYGWLNRQALAPFKVWDAAFKKIYGAMYPYFFKRPVHAHIPPATRAAVGFRVREIHVRVPGGATVLADVKTKEPIIAPAHYVDSVIRFSPEEFGEVWWGVSADHKNIFLASKKGVAKRSLKKMLASAPQSSSTPKFAYPIGDKMKPGKLPAAFKGL